jgi:zinc transporter
MCSGLLHAYLLDGAGGASKLTWADVEKWQPSDGVLWLHFDYTDASAQQWLAGRSGLDEIISAALSAEETRPRVTALGDGLLIALRGVNLNPGADPEDMVSIRLWVEDNRIISTRQRILLSIQDIVEVLARKKGPENSSEFLLELADKLTLRMGDVIEQAENRMAELEEEVLTAESLQLRSELAALRRQTIGLRRFLAPQREALLRLQTEKVSWLKEQDRLRLREVGDHLIRYLEDLDAVRDRAVVTQEELVNRLSDQLNQRMYILSIIAAIFLPLGFFTGLLGVNVGGIPGAENPWAFLIFILLMVLIVVFQLWFFWRKKWL